MSLWRTSRIVVLASAILIGLPIGLISGPARSKPNNRALPKNAQTLPTTPPRKTANMLADLPLVFEPNLGQTDPQVRFLTRASRMIAFLTDRENVMVLSRRKDAPGPHDPGKTPEIEQIVVRMKLEGAGSPRRLEGLDKAGSISNYFIGNDPLKWRTNIPNYARVHVLGVYNGIDLVYYGDGRKLEYDFVVRPGANPGLIHLAYEGADSLTTDQHGNLLIVTRLGALVQRKPLVYQEINGERREVQASYSIRAGKVEFALANWDRKRDLVIDPVLEYSTYLGGTDVDQARSIAVDSSGSAYVTGNTRGANFPATTGYQTTYGGGLYDAFVSKLNPAGTGLVYSTFLGGSGNDYGFGIAVNASNQAYVTGYTDSGSPGTTLFPLTPDAFQKMYGGGAYDAFVTKLNATGSALVYSTYLGGGGNDQAKGIAVDPSGAAYVIGDTDSTDFPIKAPGNAFQPTFGGNRDAFVAKLQANSADLVYSTYLGGSGQEVGYGIAVNAIGEAYAMGTTPSPNFPVTAGALQTMLVGAQDDFVTKLDTSGHTQVYSTYVGHGGESTSGAIAVDSTMSAYVTGTTQSPDFPTTPGAFQPAFGGVVDAYVFKLNPTGSAFVYSTYLGGSNSDLGYGIAVDSSGLAYVTGYTYSTNFPTTSGAFQPSLQGLYNAFVTKLNATGTELESSTYLGGNGRDQGTGIALDPGALAPAAYVTGYTQPPLSGGTNNFPVFPNPGAFQTTPGGGYDAFISKLNLPTLGPPAAITVTGGGTQSTTVGTQFGHPLQVKVTDASGNALPGVTVTFTAPSSGASATLSATSVTTDSSGIASVTATANTTAGAYVVTATVAGVTPSATFNLSNLAGPVFRIVFVQQPTNTQAGQTISPPVTVELLDAYNNPVANTSVTMSVEEGVTLGGTLTETTNASGITTFGDLKITQAGTYHLVAAAGGMTVVSSPFNITAGSAVMEIAISGGGQTAGAGSAFASPLVARVQDAFNNPIQGASVTFSAPTSGASVTFDGFGTTVVVMTDANGDATSPLMTANGILGSFQVTATTPGAPPVTFNLTNVAAAANKLAFVQQPTDTAAGSNITPAVTVQLEDSSGNPVHTPNVPITLQVFPVAASMPAPLTFGPQNTDATGLATFSNLSISQVGLYELLAESSGFASAMSHSFNIFVGQGAKISATGGTPQSAIVLTVFGAPLQATVTDGVGNPVGGVPVVFAAPTSGPSGTFGGQLTVTAITDAQGHARAVITANNIADGSYLVTATSTLITGSASFSLTNLPLSSTVLRFVQQPSNTPSGQAIAPPVTVQIQSSGGASNTAGVPIVLSLSSGTGELLGTVVQLTDATGTATFNDLRISATGPKQLTATSPSQPPAVSFTFQITAGAPATITAVSSSTPQSTTVSTLYPSLLQAQVLDIAGNPVPGVSVTFTAPTSGPSATFAATPTVVTDNNGVATAPLLTANSTIGSFAVIASAPGVSGQAAFSLTNLPQQGSLSVSPPTLNFGSQINQPAPPGQTVQVLGAGGAALSWSAGPSAPWIMVSPSSGTTPTTATISVNPAGLAAGNYSGSVVFTSPTGGTTAVLVTYTIAAKPALVITPPELVFTTSSATITPPPQALATSSSSGPISYSVTAQVATPTGGSWLKVSPGSGQTGGSVQVSVDPTGLSQGIYNGSVLFTPTDASINSVSVPVTLLVACGQGGCTGFPATILAVVNGASFHPSGAPGAAMTIFGTNLSDNVYQATMYPLPMQLGPTSVTVNGNPVPLYYASPTQINFQMPFGAPVTNVQVAVTNGFTRAPTAPPHNLNLRAVDPGLFISPGNRAAALNQDLSANTPTNPVAAGGFILLFLTGQGPISPPLADGAAAPTTPLSLITGNVQVSIGGQPAQVSYQGVAPGYAGLAQINAIVPAGLAAGDQPVFITINGVSSNAGVITVK